MSVRGESGDDGSGSGDDEVAEDVFSQKGRSYNHNNLFLHVSLCLSN